MPGTGTPPAVSPQLPFLDNKLTANLCTPGRTWLHGCRQSATLGASNRHAHWGLVPVTCRVPALHRQCNRWYQFPNLGVTVTLPLECQQPARYRNWLQVGLPVWPARSGTSPAPMELSPARCAEVSLLRVDGYASAGVPPTGTLPELAPSGSAGLASPKWHFAGTDGAKSRSLCRG